MQADLHYYVTFIAARAAGWCHEDAAEIALAAHYVDCSGDPDELKAPWKNSETLQKTITCVAQLSVAVENMRTMAAENQLIWSAFHFLPGFDTHPDSRYDYAYDDRHWSLMSGTGVERREPSDVAQSGWVYSRAVKPKAKFATPRAYKLAMRCFPNSRTIEAMTKDTIQELNSLDSSRLHQRLKITPQANPIAKELAKKTAREMREKALALIGVRLHVLADSFSHAGFAGMTSSINKEDGSWLLVDPTQTQQKEVEINYAVGSHGVAKWMAVGHAMAGALPDMPGARYCFKSPKLDVRIYKDNPMAYKYAVIAVKDFLTTMRQHVSPRRLDLDEPDYVAQVNGFADDSERAEKADANKLLETIIGWDSAHHIDGPPIFLTDEDFQFPHKSDRKTGYAGRHITSWFWGSNMWEYNADKADASLELRSQNLIARINEVLRYSRKKGSFHNLCEMLRIGEAGEAAFAQRETRLGLGGTYIANKNTEYSIVRRVRAQYWSQKDTTPAYACLIAANWAARHHIDWFNAQYGALIRPELNRPNASD